MSLLPIDPIGWLPDSIKRDIIDTVVTSIASFAQNILGAEAGNAIRRLRSDRDFQLAINAGLEEATRRFIDEYVNEDEDLVYAIMSDPDFWKASTIRDALVQIVERPGGDVANQRMVIENQFSDVLGNRKNRERVNRAVDFYLRLISETLWHLPQIKPVYEMQMQRISVDKTMEMIEQLEGLRTDVKQVFLNLGEAIKANKELVSTQINEDASKLYQQRIYTNLPNPDYGKFVGREKEQATIIEILRPYPDSQYPVVVIDGIGGIGKSTLALQIAHYYLNNYFSLLPKERFDAIIWTSAKSSILTADGVIQRSQINRTLEDIFATISLTLKREDITRSGFEEQHKLVNNALAQQRTLLIIDNLETIDDERVTSFLHELPAPTKAIVTTRHRIDIAYPIRLTGMPKNDGLELINELCIEKKVDLNFNERERLFDLTGGVPLAMTWVIAQISYGENKSVTLQRLQNQYTEISHFCFDTTIKLIEGKDAYKILKAMSIISTDASREMLNYLIYDKSASFVTYDDLALLERLSLVNKSQGRYNLLPLTKYYAQLKLRENKEFQKEVLYRAFLYYKNRIEERDRSDFYYHPWLDTEKNNILYLLDQFHNDGYDEYVAEIMKNFDVYLWVRGLWDESLKHLKITLMYAEEKGNIDLQAHANRALGRIYIYRGKYELAKMHLEEAYRLYKKVNNYRQIVSSATYLSIIYAYQKNISEAEQILNDSQDAAKKSNEDETIIRIQNALAEIEIEQDKLGKAQARIENILKMDKVKDAPASTLGIGTTYFVAGKLALYHKEFDKARYYFERSLSIASNRGIEQDIGYNFLWLASLKQAEENVDDARELAEKALEFFNKIGDIRGAQQVEDFLNNLDSSWKKPFLKRFTEIDKYD